jgi:hypothetical protein
MLHDNIVEKFQKFIFSEVASGFFYKSAEEREKLLRAERDFIEGSENH